jgi:hypothetical protein
LSEKPELTSEERTELLDAAHAAAHHWRRIGTAGQVAQADLLLGRAHAIVGNGTLARKFAKAALDFTTSRSSSPWELALAHAIMADAAAASGDAPFHAQHYEKAKALGEGLAGEDRDLFLATFNRVPRPRESL